MLRLSVNLAMAVFLTALPAVAQNGGFEADSAYAYLEHLCVAIGPRPMGSVNERAALKWTAEKFRNFGADTVYVMHVPEARGTINTNSGVAIGIFRGTTDSTIVIGGHIDSAGREIPGANDDGSGTACVIELARVWGQRHRHFTLLFAAFGGEESGLVGSKYFVDHYADLDKVHLMLQIDMAGDASELIPFIDVYSHQAPEWLVEDAYAFDRLLGYNSLKYPTHFFTLNNSFKNGGAGSDHQPFLEKNIPAIDFTAGVNTSAIHTQQDRIGFISKPMLARSGRLVDSMVNKYQQNGIPAPKKGNYMLWQVFGERLYVPLWLISATEVIALLMGLAAFYWSRKNRLRIEKNQRIRFSGFKLFLMAIIATVFAQFGEAFLQSLRELRYAWFVPLNQYLWYTAIWALGGIWTAVQLTRKWKFSPDPYVYAKRAIMGLLVLSILFSLASARLALYPALSLIALSSSILLRNVPLKVLATVLAPLPMLRLMFFETFPLIARSMAESGQNLNNFLEAFIYSGILTLILVVWYLPTFYQITCTLVSSWPKLDLIKNFRSPAVGLALLLAIIGFGGYLYSIPAYDEQWRAELEVNGNYGLRSGKAEMRLTGNEYFRQVTVTADTLRRHYDDSIHEAELPLAFKADWFRLRNADSSLLFGQDVVHVSWQLVSSRPWFQVKVTLRTDTLEITHVESPLKYRHRKDNLIFSWYSEPPETLHVAAHFSIHPHANLIREITAIYPETPLPIQVKAELADVIYRTTVTYRDTLKMEGQKITTD